MSKFLLFFTSHGPQKQGKLRIIKINVDTQISFLIFLAGPRPAIQVTESQEGVVEVGEPI